MSNIVYLLGAGFSAPLGLPVMANFIETSKDLYFEDPQRFDSFKRIFRILNDMSRAMLYYSVDLHNIEEALSILEMQEQLSDNTDRAWFIKYIKDVIEAKTPSVPLMRERRTSNNWHGSPFTNEHVPRIYSAFVASLLGLHFSLDGDLIKTRIAPSRNSYSVITLNYDLVLESHAAAFGHSFSRPGESEGSNGVRLAKLHGSLDRPDVVAPTWNKSLTPGIVPEWRLAFDLLSKANHLRIIGYSLPIADAYIRFLLKSALINSVEVQGTPHLKRVDVICRDPSGSVQERYDSFMRHPNYYFYNADIVSTLSPLPKGDPVNPFAPEFTMADRLESLPLPGSP